MEKEYGGYAIAIDSPESIILPLRQYNQTKNKKSEYDQYGRGSQKALLLAYRTKDKIRILFRTYFNLVCVPFKNPFPDNPPEPIAILD